MKELAALILLVTIFNNIPIIWMLNHNNIIWMRPPRNDNINIVETMNYKFVGPEIPGASQHCEPEKCAELCHKAYVNTFQSYSDKNYICTHFSYINGKCTLFQVYGPSYPLSMTFSENTYSGMLLDRMPKWDLSFDGGVVSHEKMACTIWSFEQIMFPISKSDCSGTCFREKNCKSFSLENYGVQQYCSIGSRVDSSLRLFPAGVLEGFPPATNRTTCGFSPDRHLSIVPNWILLDNGYTEQVLWTSGYAVAGIEGTSFKTFDDYTNMQCMESCKKYPTSCLYFSKSNYIDAKGANRSTCTLYGQQSYPFYPPVKSYNAGDSSGIFLDRIPKWTIGMRSTINNSPAKTEWMDQVTWSERCIISADGPEIAIENITNEECAIKCLDKHDCIFFNWNRDSQPENTGKCKMLAAAPLLEIAYYKTMPDFMCGFIMARFQAHL